jgi:hypothetical protein
MEKKLQTFSDLDWYGSRARAFFENGYGVSVVAREALGNILLRTSPLGSPLADIYADAKDTYELVILKGTEEEAKIIYDTPINETEGDILILNEEGVSEIMKRVQALPIEEI